ncbi:MAG: hypothetical protein KIG95_08275, partial [Comamonas sp.]|nr:hypothetical protein [Comamonas sp.]
GLYRRERFPLPMAALREAILNAVVHKDYASGIPIQISVYADKLMVWNPGQLPDDWTLDKLMTKHASRPFNPDIASAFFRAGLIEAWGRGIERIIEACQQENYPTPQWQVEPGGLWVVFGLEIARQRDDVGIGGGVNEGVNEGVKSLLILIEQHPGQRTPFFAQQMNTSVKNIERWLKTLREQALVEFRGAPKTGGYFVREQDK